MLKSQKVIVEKFSKTGAKRSTRRENVTMVAMVNAAGVYLLLLVSWKGKQWQLAWLPTRVCRARRTKEIEHVAIMQGRVSLASYIKRKCLRYYYP